MQITLKDRNKILHLLRAGDEADLSRFLSDIVKLAEQTNYFPCPDYEGYLTKSAPKPVTSITRSKPERTDESSKARDFSEKAIKWAKGRDIDHAWRSTLKAKSRQCTFGHHKIELGSQICKIEAFDDEEELKDHWGCVPCFDAIVEEYDIEVED